MARIALDGATITQTTASGHIQYRVWEFQYRDSVYGDIYGWSYYSTSAYINGRANATVTNVKIQGKSPIVQGDRTSESDSYSIPRGEYYSGAHSNAAGSVTGGNSNNVFVNGKSVSLQGSSVRTHANTNSSINGGTSTTVNIGG